MSEFTAWYPVTNPDQANISGTTWDDLTNIAVDDATFSAAIAPPGTMEWINNITKVVRINGNSLIDPHIPDNATFDSVEVKMYFEQPQALINITGVAIIRSSSRVAPVFAEELAEFPLAPSLQTVDYSVAVDDVVGRDIAEGGDILWVYGSGPGLQTFGWQVNWRFAELRIEFTRAPHTPASPFIAMF